MKYEYWFAGIRNIPDRTKIKLKEKAGTAEAIYYIEETALRKFGSCWRRKRKRSWTEIMKQ